MRVFCLSDIHVDHVENQRWIAALSKQDFQDDLLLLAGDATHRMNLLEETLSQFKSRFARVGFIPGNHELWRDGDVLDGVIKFRQILALCREMDVIIDPVVLEAGNTNLRIVPLFSWYTRPEEGEDSLFVVKKDEDPKLKVWADDAMIQWPAPNGKSMTQYFLDLNIPRLEAEPGETVISFSHFLPRRDLIFSTETEDQPFGGKVKDFFPPFNFSRVAGTSLLDQQIRRLGAHCHVYGHQHRNRSREIDGIRYISHCLGYGRERRNGAIRHIDQGPRLIWSAESGFEEN